MIRIIRTFLYNRRAKRNGDPLASYAKSRCVYWEKWEQIPGEKAVLVDAWYDTPELGVRIANARAGRSA